MSSPDAASEREWLIYPYDRVKMLHPPAVARDLDRALIEARALLDGGAFRVEIIVMPKAATS